MESPLHRCPLIALQSFHLLPVEAQMQELDATKRSYFHPYRSFGRHLALDSRGKPWKAV